MDIKNMSCGDLVGAIASNAPAPGGGGASAIVGAIGTALGNMVGSLTIGKKKYADVEKEIIELKKRADAIQKDLLDLAEKDAEVFLPLSEAYRMPKDTPEQAAEKETVMEKCLADACAVPLEIMRKAGEGIELAAEFAKKGSRLAISDAGVSAACLKAALTGASLNVFINTAAMKDRDTAGIKEREAHDIIGKYSDMADEIFEYVKERL